MEEKAHKSLRLKRKETVEIYKWNGTDPYSSSFCTVGCLMIYTGRLHVLTKNKEVNIYDHGTQL